MPYKTPNGNVMYSSSDFQEPIRKLPEELVKAARIRDKKLADLGATLVIVHDEYLVQAPVGKEQEAMDAVSEYTNKLLIYQMKGFKELKLPLKVTPDFTQTWEELASSRKKLT